MTVSRSKTAGFLLAALLLLMTAADAMAGRRSLRIDFNAWSNAYNIESSDHCPMHISGGTTLADALFRFENRQDPDLDPYTTNMYCQDIPNWDVFENPGPDDYLNSAVFGPDEAGLAAKIGENKGSNPVTAIRYTFLNGPTFGEGTTGYQWAFYNFWSAGVTIVALYTDLVIESSGFAPFIQSNFYYNLVFWDSAQNGFDGQYFCFQGGDFIGFWDGEYAGTDPADGCTLDFVSNRDALVALYNSTDGENWYGNNNWLTGDPCGDGWEGVLCGADCYEEGDELICDQGFPYAIGLDLAPNNLVGTIPPELGSLTQLEELNLARNHLTGSIPTEMGNLLNLAFLWLQGNQLSGIVPAELCNLTDIYDFSVEYNRLNSPDTPLCALQDAGGTQTIAPLGFVITTAESPSIELAWDAIEYTADAGRYRAWYSTSPEGPFVDGGATGSKTDTSLTINGLENNTTYYIVVRTETDAHSSNPNDLESEDSAVLISLFSEIFGNGFE